MLPRPLANAGRAARRGAAAAPVHAAAAGGAPGTQPPASTTHLSLRGGRSPGLHAAIVGELPRPASPLPLKFQSKPLVFCFLFHNFPSLPPQVCCVPTQEQPRGGGPPEVRQAGLGRAGGDPAGPGTAGAKLGPGAALSGAGDSASASAAEPSCCQPCPACSPFAPGRGFVPTPPYPTPPHPTPPRMLSPLLLLLPGCCRCPACPPPHCISGCGCLQGPAGGSAERVPGRPGGVRACTLVQVRVLGAACRCGRGASCTGAIRRGAGSAPWKRAACCDSRVM